MKLAVVIPNYNGERTIEKCLESIYAQRVQSIEVILVDDKSTDRSVEIIQNRFPRVIIIRNRMNFGAAFARNEGIRKSKGEILLFVDSDVYLLNSCIEEMLQYINEFDIVYPSVFFENGEILSPASVNEKLYIRRSPVFMVRKDSLNKLNEFFDDKYSIYYEDVDFFMRCYLAGLKSKYADNAIAHHAIIPRHRDLERRFYLEAKNRIYCMIKFSNTPRSARNLLLIPTLRDILHTARVAYSNRNIYSIYPDHVGDNRLTSSRAKLICIFFKAIWGNVLNLRETLDKRMLIGKSF